MPKKTGKLADALFGQPEEKAAFGVFPQMKPRRSQQDPEAAKNFPVDVARGFASGVLGAPGDIESLIRLLPGLDEKTVLPTSEEIEKRIPLRSDTPVSRAATGMGQLGGGFYMGPGSPLRLAAGLPGAVVSASKDFAMAAGSSGPRIFVGPKAKTWDQAAADAAARLEKQGIDPVEIWKQTGTFRGVDGILRQEIDDRAALFLTPDERKEMAAVIKGGIDVLKEKIKTTPQKDLFPKALTEAKKDVREKIATAKEELADYKKDPSLTEAKAYTVFHHPELYKAYPELAKIPVETGGYGGEGTRGSLSIFEKSDKSPGSMSMDIYQSGLQRNPTSTTLHEMQHAVQTLEGMSPGGNQAMAFKDPRAFDILQRLRYEIQQPPSFAEFQKANRYPTEDEAKKAYSEFVNSYNVPITPAIERDLQENAAREYYRRLAGEAEARAVQDRQMMTPEQRRDTPPAASYDVPQEDLLTKPPKQYKKGGKVQISDNPDTMRAELAQIKPTEVRSKPALGAAKALQKAHEFVSKPFGYPNPPAAMISEFLGVPAIARTLERVGYGQPITNIGKANVPLLPEDTSETILSVAPLASVTKGLPVGAAIKKSEKVPAVPLDIPRVRPTKQDILEAAERVGRQQAGEHVRSPLLNKTENLAGRSMAESKRVQALKYELEPTKDIPNLGVYEPKIGEVNIALPGDQTVADVILKSVDDIPVGSVQEGGANFGLGKLELPEEKRAFWASNFGPAQIFQNKVTEIARKFNTDLVTAYHLAMGTDANNFAQHFADANLRAIDYSKMTKGQMEAFDQAIAYGYIKKNPKTGEYVHTSFPEWPGIADPDGAYLAMKENPELRKWFNNRMKTPKLTEATNMPDGRSIEWAITEPEIRNMEINMTGLSAGRMKPGAELIPESAHQTYSHDIPGTALGRAPELAPFSISFPDVTEFVRQKYRPQDFTGTIQKVFPHQVVDEAYLEDLATYYNQLRKVRGFAEGGAVDGDITGDDLTIEERPL
jgi:hypothetical protein